MTVASIKEAIQGLRAGQRASLAAWLHELERKAWDEEIERDFSSGGRGTKILEHVKQQVRAGRSKPMDDSFNRGADS